MIDTTRAIRTPCQQRSRNSLERILKTAESLIRSKGFEALTVAEVVRRSHTSVGTFYARFRDKTALLMAVQERVIAREEKQMRDQVARVDWSKLTLEESVRKLVDIKREVARGNEKLYEAFVIHGATDAAIRERGYRSKAALEDLEVQILMDHADEIAHPDPEKAIRVACRVWQAAREEQVQRSRSGVRAGSVPEDLLLQELADVVIAYLKTPVQAAAEQT